MKIFNIAALCIAFAALTACDDDTATIGNSITNAVDNIQIDTLECKVTTASLAADSVLSSSGTVLLGKVKDPETGTYVTGDYMTQLGVLPSFDIDTLEYIKSAYDGEIKADSCFLLISYKSTYGDTLAPMKIKAYEMSQVMPEGKNYYTNFDAFADGYVSEDNYYGSATHSLESSVDAFKIYLNKPYTKDGKTYSNYGTYIMQTYYEHPEYFTDNYTFLHKVCPGFFLQHEGGIGSVANVWNTELQFYWTRKKTLKASDGVTDSTVIGVGYNRFDGTEEVLQLNKIANDTRSIRQLAADESCTYIKSPAGIFTVATLPVDEIMQGHENDTISSASITFQRINNVDENNDYNFSTPSTLLMIPKDSLYSFFEHGNVYNNRTSYICSYNSSSTSTLKNAYTFSNIANLIRNLYNRRNTSADWNKVVLIPVNVTTTTQDSYTVASTVTHDMTLASTRLVRGTEEKPIKLKVIYSKFQDK